MAGMPTRPPARRRAPAELPPQRVPTALEELIWGTPGKKLVTAAMVLTAGIYISGVLKPVVESHLPSASQGDLSGVADSLKKGLDQTVATATAANANAQQALRQSLSNQLDRLLSQRVQLETLVNMNPNDTTLKLALEKTNIDINTLTQQQSALPVLAVPPSTK